MQTNISDGLLDTIFLKAPVGIVTIDDNLIINSVNSTALQFELTTATSIDELIGLRIDSLPLFKTPQLLDDLNGLKDGIPFEAELSNKLTLDGNEITVIIKASANFENEIFAGAIFIIEDFKVPLALSPNKIIKNELFNKFVKSISDYFMITNSRGEIIYSPPIGSLKSHNNIFDKKHQLIKQIFGGKHEETILELFHSAITSKKPIFSQSIADNINTSINFQLNFIPIVNNSDKVDFVFVLFEDITDTFNKIQNLENEAKELRTYQSIASTVLDAIIAFDEKGIITFWNNAATKVFGLNKIETYGKFIGSIIEDFTRDYFDKAIITLKESNIFETKIQYNLHGITRSISIKMALAEDDETQSVVALCSDISDRENFEKALRNSEETFRNIVTNTREYICTYTLEGKITYINPYFIEKFGYSEYELQEKEITSLIDLDELDNNKFKLDKIVNKDSEIMELPLIKKNGEKVFVLANFTSVSNLQGDPRYYIAVFTDITDKKESEEELNLIRSVFETAIEGIVLINKEKISLANISFANMFGYETIDEILNLDSLDFICKKDKERAKKDLESIKLENKTPKYIYEGKKKNGEIIIIEKGCKKFSSLNNNYII